MELDSLPTLEYPEFQGEKRGLNSFMIEGSPFFFMEGITISRVITLRSVVVVGNEVGIVVNG